MRRPPSRIAGLLLALAAAAAGAADGSPVQPGVDEHSFANVEQFRITHVDLDLRVDFDSQSLRGQIGMRIERLDPNATQLILDTRDLIVHEVTQKATDVLGAEGNTELPWVSRPFHFERADPVLGSALVIDLPPSRKSRVLIRIDYETAPRPRAIGWLLAKPGSGRRQPLMYALPGPIAARSWLPLQDTPQARFSYKALIHTPEDLRAVMSPAADPKAARTGVYSFSMVEDVPAAALGLAVGDLQFKALGPRSGVYAEKPLLRAAAAEFADTEAMIDAAQKLLGPRAPPRFDAVVLGPRFPIAGASSPRLAFLSSTLLTGDRSRLSPLAAALADQWTFAPAAWRDAWVAEAVGRYAAIRILGAVYGAAAADLEQLAALDALRLAYASRPAADQPLAMDLRGRDPWPAVDACTRVKGGLLFSWLEGKFGRDRLDEYLRGMLARFAGREVSTEQFLADLRQELLDRQPGIATLDEVLAWVSGPGLPRGAVLPPAEVWRAVDAARAAWLADATPIEKSAAKSWLGPHWVRFLDGLPAGLPEPRVAELERSLGVRRQADPAVGRAWFALLIRNGHPAGPPLEAYLAEVGRGSLVEPLYQAMLATPAGAAAARRVYAQARPGYHPLVVAALDPSLKPEPDPETSDAE